MRKLLAIVILSLTPLSGCSSPEPELSYDPVELIEYENCLNNPPAGLTEAFGLKGFAENYCSPKKPVLK